MAFYIIEKYEQLQQLGPFKDCFVKFIPYNDNYHPKLNDISLIYVRDISHHKGYMLCINHNESFSLNKQDVEQWLLNKTEHMFVLDKKQTLHYFPYQHKLYDINFIENINLLIINKCIDFYYKKYNNLSNINTLIPISKHYEICDIIFDNTIYVINKYHQNNVVYAFNNGPLSYVFNQIESCGIRIDKNNFTNYYNNLNNPEFNIKKGKIYTCYNLYNITGRPSNNFNGINFLSLNKTNGERQCYIPENDTFIEIDIQGLHPRLIANMIGFEFGDKNTYELLGELLNVTQQEAKELTFKQMYGGIWEEYQDKPFFKDVNKLTNEIWEKYQINKQYETKNRIFLHDKNMIKSKLLSYIIQSAETSGNVEFLVKILDYLKDKKTKLVLYTYDAILLDYSKEDGKQLLNNIKDIIPYPINIKIGNTYHDLQKI
jgi:hypothetical protein